MIIAQGLIVAVLIFLLSHLTVDKDFPEKIKLGTWIVFGIGTFLYTLIGIF